MSRLKRTVSLLVIASFVLILPLFPADKQPEFSLEAVLSAPHASQLTVSTAGDRVAWVMNIRGQKSIWLAEGPDFRARQLILYESDDGRTISNLQFSPEGSFLLYGYGSAFNPTSSPRRLEQVIRVVDLKSGKDLLLVEGQNPLISPDGKNVLFTRAGEPYVIPFDGTAGAKRLFQARGSNRSFEWSPDSKRVLFVSFRESHSFIGVYDLEQDKIIWLLPDVYRDMYPVWSRDGKSVAFIRMPPRQAQGSSFSRGKGVPFTIWVVDLENLEGRKIWETETGGGFAHSYPGKPLCWSADDRIVFYSEHTGWMHLYSVSAKTGEMLALTSGEYEVEQMTVSPDGQYVVFSANKGDIHRKHLWKVSVRGGPIEAITEGQSLEWEPEVSSDGKHLFFIQSTARRPGLPVMKRLDGKSSEFRPLIAAKSVASEFPEDKLVIPEVAAFKSPDGLPIYGQLFLPEGIKAGEKLPAVIFMHGGPTRQMYPAWHHSEYYHKCYAFNQYLAACGYVVLSVNFRCGIGYGASFREAPNQGPRGASEYQDILAAAEFLKKLPAVDASRIGLWGGSYGGYLTALGLARNSDIFAAGVDFHGVHDWALRAKRRSGGGWGIGEEEMEMAFKSSPVADVEKWTSPVLFVHGDDDRNVDFIQTTDLVRRLLELEKAHLETLVFPDDVHSFLVHKNWVRAFKAASDFFDRFLKNR
jgi:dipeptidyl aminopeptidase/acylaminoacyl peptidase